MGMRAVEAVIEFLHGVARISVLPPCQSRVLPSTPYALDYCGTCGPNQHADYKHKIVKPKPASDRLTSISHTHNHLAWVSTKMHMLTTKPTAQMEVKLVWRTRSISHKTQLTLELSSYTHTLITCTTQISILTQVTLY